MSDQLRPPDAGTRDRWTCGDGDVVVYGLASGDVSIMRTDSYDSLELTPDQARAVLAVLPAGIAYAEEAQPYE